jgi:PAS domain S-box-containing protein
MDDQHTPAAGPSDELASLRRRVAELEAVDAARRQVEELLRTSEERFRRTFDLSPVGAVIVGSDFRFLRCNEAFCRFLGYTESELQEKTFPGVTYPDDREIGVAEARAILAGRLEAARVQKRYQHRSGRAVWGEASIRLVRDAAGQPLYFLTVVQDTNERKEAEELLHRSEERYRLLFRSINDAVFVCGVGDDRLPGRFIEVNDIACERLGYTREELLSMRPMDVEGPAEWAAFQEQVIPRLRSDRRAVWEGLHVHKDGHRIPVEISTNLFGYEGKLVAVTTVRDLTERKRSEQKQRELEVQMQQAQKLESLGILAGGIAHDFNNLLTAILGHANLALMDLAPESPVRDSLREIDKASGRAAELCRQMLAYAGKGRFVVEPINLSRLIEELAHLLRVSISKKVLLRCHLAEGLPAIEADPAQLRQVAMNLVINAAEAIGATEGIIAISTGVRQCDKEYLRGNHLIEELAPGQYVFLEVADTGCGMDAETRRRIFDPFFTTKFAGRGLGLAAVLGIVRSHQGMLKVESEPGRGTTFRVLFPAVARSVVSAESGENPPWRGTGTVLLVDDEESVRNVAGRMLERCGFKVIRAGDGREAVERFRTQAAEIVCVLLDLAMPRMDGEETFRELRRIKPDVRVVLATGYSDQEIAERFCSAGLAGFIEKPYRVEALSAKLRAVLG